MESKYKKALEEILMNLRCIDATGNDQIDSYIDDSISIVQAVMEEENKTALEVPVQEQPKININQLRSKNGLDPISNGDIDFIAIK